MVRHSDQMPLHIARKAIPTINTQGVSVHPTEVNGEKMELFIFDSFSFAHNLVALEVSVGLRVCIW
jgi:UDP-N-acetylglucosamine/UDP-N-acetylgalactosamine diphosphorylase